MSVALSLTTYIYISKVAATYLQFLFYFIFWCKHKFTVTFFCVCATMSVILIYYYHQSVIIYYYHQSVLLFSWLKFQVMCIFFKFLMNFGLTQYYKRTVIGYSATFYAAHYRSEGTVNSCVSNITVGVKFSPCMSSTSRQRSRCVWIANQRWSDSHQWEECGRTDVCGVESESQRGCEGGSDRTEGQEVPWFWR